MRVLFTHGFCEGSAQGRPTLEHEHELLPAFPGIPVKSELALRYSYPVDFFPCWELLKLGGFRLVSLSMRPPPPPCQPK